MRQARIYLVTRGADLGTNHSTNAAIMEAYRNGILKSAALLAICPDAGEAAEMFAGEKDLCCGLHSALNSEWDAVRWGPVLPPEKVPSLLDANGHLFQTTEALRNRGPNTDQVFMELQAQLDFARKLGFDIRFADMHMAWGIAVEGIKDRYRRWCEREGIICHYDFPVPLPRARMEGDPVEQVIASLEAARPGTYVLAAHPAYDNEEMRALGHPGYPGEVVAREREWERRIFTDPRVIEYCRNSKVVPIRHDEVDRVR